MRYNLGPGGMVESSAGTWVKGHDLDRVFASLFSVLSNHVDDNPEEQGVKDLAVDVTENLLSSGLAPEMEPTMLHVLERLKSRTKLVPLSSMSLKQAEEKLIRRTLLDCCGDRVEASRKLGVSERKLSQRIVELGLNEL